VLACYARSRKLDDRLLAEVLGCAAGDLVDLCLCRAPRADPAGFRADVERIAGRFGVDAGRLAEVVRRGQSLLVLQQQPTAPAGRLLAAREVEP
jgi:hypothetical protein